MDRKIKFILIFAFVLFLSKNSFALIPCDVVSYENSEIPNTYYLNCQVNATVAGGNFQNQDDFCRAMGTVGSPSPVISRAAGYVNMNGTWKNAFGAGNTEKKLLCGSSSSIGDSGNPTSCGGFHEDRWYIQKCEGSGDDEVCYTCSEGETSHGCDVKRYAWRLKCFMSGTIPGTPQERCGNTRCDNNETIDTCPQDCGFCTDQTPLSSCSEATLGLLCKRYGDKAALVPNCDGDDQPKCSCGSGKVCAIGSVDENLIGQDSPVYNIYVPLFNDFQNESNVPNITYDGATGTGSIDVNNGRNGGWSYKILKGNAGKIYASFTVPVEFGARYEAEAYVKTQNNRPNESVRIFSGSDSSAFAKPSVSWDRLSYTFTAQGNSNTLSIEVNKQGTYYIDDVKIKKLDNICHDQCKIIEQGTGFTRTENADKETTVTTTVRFMGACQAPFYFQVDAVDSMDDITCGLDHNNAYGLGSEGWMQGIDIKCEESDIRNEANGVKSCSNTWIVPAVPADCAGKRVTAAYGAIWYNGIGEDSSNFIDQWTFSNPNMYLEFVEEPMPQSCNDGNFDGDEEQCDASAGMLSIACTSLNAQLNETYIEGNATCTNRCRWDTFACEEIRDFCGTNDRVDPEYGEECDPSAPLQSECSDLTYDGTNYYSGGTLGCYPKSSDNFCKFDKSRCTKPAVCPDGIKDSGEDCDGSDFGEVNSCNDVHENFMPAGSLGCNPDCSYDISNCRPDGCTSSPAGTGVCELPFENRQECQDCAAEFSNVRSEQSGGNTRFSGTISGVSGTPWLQEFIACNYVPGFSNLGRCISQYNDNECGFDRTTGQPKDCICNDLTTSCSVQCFDYGGKFYLYAEGIVGPAGETIDFKIRSDKAAFSCEQVGLNDLRSLKDEIDTKTYIAFSNWQYAQQHGLPSAGTWRSVESALSSMQAALKQFFDSYEQGSPVNAAEVQDLIAQANAALQQADELVRSIGG